MRICIMMIHKSRLESVFTVLIKLGRSLFLFLKANGRSELNARTTWVLLAKRGMKNVIESTE